MDSNINSEIQRLTNNIAMKASYSYIRRLGFVKASSKVKIGAIGDLGTFYVKDDRYIFVEAKAADNTLKTVKIPNQPFMAEQGTLQYLTIVIAVLKQMDKTLYDIIKKEINKSQLEYFLTFQAFNEDESLGEFSISQFDI